VGAFNPRKEGISKKKKGGPRRQTDKAGRAKKKGAGVNPPHPGKDSAIGGGGNNLSHGAKHEDPGQACGDERNKITRP